MNFLVQQQSENGSFIEGGYIHDLILQGGGGGSPYSLTAFTLLAFVAVKNLPSLQEKNRDNPSAKEYANVLDSGLNWLLKEDIQDTYSILLICYLLHLLDHPQKERYFKLVEERALTDSKGGYKFWEKGHKKEVQGNNKGRVFMGDFYEGHWYHDRVKPASVEMTAYALLIYLMREVPQGQLIDSIAIGRWLLKQRNECGGFISTQDTVVGLTALAKLAEATHTTKYQMVVRVKCPSLPGQGQGFTFYIGKDNTTTLQEYFLPPSITQVDIEAEGIGTALAQLNWIYYTFNVANSSEFSLDVKVDPKDKNRRLEITICTSCTQGEKSNMVILEVNTPTGYAFEQDELQDLKTNPMIKRFEIEESDSKVNIYFSFLTNAKTCVAVIAHRIHLVAKYSKSSVVVYDYYDTTRKITQLYDGPEVDVCQICALDYSCKVTKCL